MSLGLILKLCVAAVLFAFIASKVDLSEAAAAAAGIKAGPLALAVLASLGITLADAAFWAFSMRNVGCRMAFGPSFLFSFVGWFFANIAPSSIGADIFRTAQMRYGGVPVSSAFRVVAAARLASFATLIAVIAAGLPLARPLMGSALDWLMVIGAALAGALALAGLMLAGPTLARLPFMARLSRAIDLGDLARDLSALLFRGPEAVVGWALLVAQHLLRVATIAAIAAALCVNVGIGALFALIPAALLVAMVPVSVGGWGVREMTFVYFLQLAGVSAAAALAISVVYGLVRLAFGAVAGVVWVVARRGHFAVAMNDRALNRQDLDANPSQPNAPAPASRSNSQNAAIDPTM